MSIAVTAIGFSQAGLSKVYARLQPSLTPGLPHFHSGYDTVTSETPFFFESPRV